MLNSDKNRVRAEFLKLRDSIGGEERCLQSAEIERKLTDTAFYRKAKVVFIYVSFGSEADTHGLIRKILADGKRAAVPLCDTKSHTMCAVEITDMGQLAAGSYGILEPRAEMLESGELEEVGTDEIDLAVVPAAVYDKSGARIGYGGGYYDRFLRNFDGVSVGIAFSQCVTECLPSDAWDETVDMVICP